MAANDYKLRVSVDALHAIHDCALGMSPVISFSLPFVKKTIDFRVSICAELVCCVLSFRL